MPRTLTAILIGVASALYLASCVDARSSQRRDGADQGWIASFEMAPTRLPEAETYAQLRAAHPELQFPPFTEFSGTIRYRVRIARGGARLRLAFTNPYAEVLPLTHASVALINEAGAIEAGSLREVRFDDKAETLLASHGSTLSDPLTIRLSDGADLLVSIYLPSSMTYLLWTPRPGDPLTLPGGDHTMDETLAGDPRNQRPILSRVDVAPTNRGKVIVALGDSITDGVVDGEGVRGWPGVLAARAARENISVVNAGIFGNRLLRDCGAEQESALRRLDRDALSVPGVTDVVLLEGINDIGMSDTWFLWCGESPVVTADEIVHAYTQIIARAHQRGVRVIGGTLTPFAGALAPFGYYSPEKERIRQAVNHWIRSSGKFDSVVDFDAVMRDPADPAHLRAEFDPGDHLHPNAAGVRAMAELVKLQVF